MAAQFVLTVVIFQLAISGCYAVSGIIWHKQQQKFVQLFSIPQFAALQKENLARRRALEMQDMKGEVVKAAFYEEKNMVMFYDNNTKVDGICGNVWDLLASYLNFTFIPVKSINRDFGERLENGTQNGLIGMLARNEAQAIMRSGFYRARMDFVDFTTPLWSSSYHIYVRPKWLFDNTWVLTLFSWQTWFYTGFLFIILSCVGYFLQKVPTNKPKHKKKGLTDFNLGDHFFYTFVIMSARGNVPDTFYNNFKILSFSKSIFAWLVLLAFSAHLIYRMTNRQLTLPFQDVESLLNNTKYVLLAFRGTFLYNSFNHHYRYWIDKHPSAARIRFIDVAENMHNKICNNMQKYAMFEIEDRFMATNRNGCPLQATGTYNKTWITFALQKNFRYRKTLNSALIKFREVGLMDGLVDHWFNTKIGNVEQAIFKNIDFSQVYLIFVILYCGILISFVILVLEKITYYYKTKNAWQRRRR